MHFSKFSKIHKNYTVGPIFRRGTWEHLGMTSGAPQGGTPQAGAASKGGAPPWCVWVPLYPTLASLSPTLFSLPKKLAPGSSHSRFCSRTPDFSISLLSPDFCLKFGTFALRYVTPPIIQVEFCLVEYILNILLL